MAKVLKTLKNHWKKSVLATGIITYGCDLLYNEHKKTLLIRRYCQEVIKSGDVPLSVSSSPRHIAVILNPASNKGKGKKEYENYCAPLLHLSGACVSLLITNPDNDSVELVKKIPKNIDAIVIAGGDGTVSEVVTGLLRLKRDNDPQKLLPIGILPLGKSNSLAQLLYAGDASQTDRLFRYHVMMEAAYSIVREITKKISAMEIMNIEVDNNEQIFKPVYAVSHVHVGAFRDAEAKKDKFWYFGGMRSYVNYLFGSYNRNSPLNIELQITPPCAGCSKCHRNRKDLARNVEDVKQKRWWHAFIPRFRQSLDSNMVSINYETVENAECDKVKDMFVNTTELSIVPENIDNVAQLCIGIGPEKLSYIDFVKEGWMRIRNHGCIESTKKIYAQKLLVDPKLPPGDETWLSIDKEEYELKKIKIELLHNILQVFIPVTGTCYQQ